MTFDAFDEGIIPGGIRSKNEIRILICYLIDSVKVPVSKEIILESLQRDGLANYFEASSCFDELVNKEHIISDNNKDYILNSSGKLIASQLSNTVPLTVKEKALFCALSILEQQKKDRENKVEIEKSDNGYYLKCSMSGGAVSLLDFKLYVPNYDEAKILKKNLRENPELLYKTMLSVLTKQKDLLGETLTDMIEML